MVNPDITYRKLLTLFAITIMAATITACSDSDPMQPTETMAAASDDSAAEHIEKHLNPKYICPMHPQIIKDEEGSCPICGMDLVKKLIEDSTDKAPVVSVRGEIIQSMGLRTDKVKKDTLWKYIKTVGRIEYDETRLTHIHPRAAGWMETLKLRAEGDPVTKGQHLGNFYSPDILAAQVDYLIAVKDRNNKRSDIKIGKARNQLRLLGVHDSTILQIEKAGESQNTVPVYATQDGIVTMLGAREGMYIQPQNELFTIADDSRMWVQIDVYEHQLDWVKEGLDAEITVPAYPGRAWEGKVEYLYPELDKKARTLRVRLAFDNLDGALRPNMFVNAVIYGGPRRDVLTIPQEALIVTGERESVVKVIEEGRFQPVDVVTGMQQGGKVEILSGLNEGDEVVTSGQFLIDSESALRASFSRLSGE
jgi:Cu(I)/Ag(I) efflux system membrane fusion protein